MENNLLQEVPFPFVKRLISHKQGISKDFQIKILEEKLAFVQRQLEEKDKQLEHYKGLVKTMQELLDNRTAAPKAAAAAPPGFGNKGNFIFVYISIDRTKQYFAKERWISSWI